MSIVAAALLLTIVAASAPVSSHKRLEICVSRLELKLRSILDKVLIVRPRTKEFLIGHPALFLGIAAALGGRRGWAALLLVIGTIGEVSLINTFCHIHTPIEVTVLRVIIGAVVGVLIGIVVLRLFSRPAGERRSGQHSQETERAKMRVQK
jgi:hypothetical protein